MIKIASWNIGEDRVNIGNVVNLDSYEYIKQILLKNEIDIICFQENITSSSNMISISNYITKNTELKYSCNFELSPSHINNDCMMGVTICSKYKIDNYENIMFENPKLKYKKNETTTYVSHDKGFVIAYIDEIPIVIASGHCLPFHIFKKSPMEYSEIFRNMESKFIDIFKNNSNVIIAGDMNYSNVEELFPEILKITKKTVFRDTYRKAQIDHVLVGKNIKCIDSKMIETRFDHNLCVVTIDI